MRSCPASRSLRKRRRLSHVSHPHARPEGRGGAGTACRAGAGPGADVRGPAAGTASAGEYQSKAPAPHGPASAFAATFPGGGRSRSRSRESPHTTVHGSCVHRSERRTRPGCSSSAERLNPQWPVPSAERPATKGRVADTPPWMRVDRTVLGDEGRPQKVPQRAIPPTARFGADGPHGIGGRASGPGDAETGWGDGRREAGGHERTAEAPVTATQGSATAAE